MNLSFYDFLPTLIVIGIAAFMFKRQERRHHTETSLFYTFEQLQAQVTVPKRDLLDSLLIVFIGISILEFGALGLWSVMQLSAIAEGAHNAATKRTLVEGIPRQWISTSIFLGGGAALLALGIRSVLANMRYRKVRGD